MTIKEKQTAFKCLYCLFNCLMKTFYISAVEYYHVRGPLFVVNAKTEKDARAKLRFRLGMGRCPNGTKTLELFNV